MADDMGSNCTCVQEAAIAAIERAEAALSMKVGFGQVLVLEALFPKDMPQLV